MTATARPVAAISWSGGKDCCLALMRAFAAFDVRAAVTMFDEAGARSRSHGLRPEVVLAQAGRLGFDVETGRGSWSTYEDGFVDALDRVAARGCTHVIFGDIFEDAHRAWNERVAARAGLVAVQPLWGAPTAGLVREFLARGGEATLVTVRTAYLDAAWLGRRLDTDAVETFLRIGVDPCGERGEYHTVVTNCPLFSAPLLLDEGERVERGGCWAVDLLPRAPGSTAC